MDGQEEGSFKFITSRGSLKRTDLESFKTNYSKIIALKLRKDEKLVSVILEKSRVLYENTLGELLPKVYKDYIYENRDQLHMVGAAPGAALRENPHQERTGLHRAGSRCGSEGKDVPFRMAS